MKECRRIKIVSNGTIGGTEIIDVESGQPIAELRVVGWKADTKNGGMRPIIDVSPEIVIEINKDRIDEEGE